MQVLNMETWDSIHAFWGYPTCLDSSNRWLLNDQRKKSEWLGNRLQRISDTINNFSNDTAYKKKKSNKCWILGAF